MRARERSSRRETDRLYALGADDVEVFVCQQLWWWGVLVRLGLM